MNNKTGNILDRKNFRLSQEDKLFSLFLELHTKEAGGNDIAKALKALADHEIKTGGPYAPKNEKADLGLNVLIAYFLSKQGVTMPNLQDLINKAILKNDFSSRYFANENLNLYLIAQFYQGPYSEELARVLKARANDPLLAKICEAKEDKAKAYDADDVDFLSLIRETAKQRFSRLSPELRNMALAQIDKTIAANKDRQMSLMPYYFRKALGAKGKRFDDKLIARLGLANIFFWTAFIIYDDFWDEDEKADPKILPIANLFARTYIDIFQSVLSKDEEFKIFFHSLMDKLDEANHWETMHCRARIKDNKFHMPPIIPDYKNYERKFQPASGHILGCLAMSVKSGYGLQHPCTKNLISYFKNYLIAMQLNDDMHDWEEDLRRGHLSTVIVMMLQEWQKQYPNKKTIDLDKDLKRMQKIFWFKTMKKACNITLSYTKKSRQALKKIDYIKKPEYLDKFINNSEKATKDALKEYQKSISFLNSL